MEQEEINIDELTVTVGEVKDWLRIFTDDIYWMVESPCCDGRVEDAVAQMFEDFIKETRDI